MSSDTRITGRAKNQSSEARAVVVVRELPHAPEKVWRALTTPHLLSEWLGKTDLEPVIGHRFGVEITPQAGRSLAFNCEVIVVETNRVLVYSWNSLGNGSSSGLRSSVRWELTPTTVGTLLRMEQSGFDTDQPLYLHGARMGWPHFVTRLEGLLVRMMR